MTPLKPIADSKQVAAAGYDATQQVLSVQYRNSAMVYHYKGVPPEVAAAFERAESKGSFLAKQVKGLYDFDMVDTAAEAEQ